MVVLVVLALVALPIIMFAPVGTIPRTVYLVFFILLISGTAIFIAKRTPRGAHGLVASEDFYALQQYYRSSRIYGDSNIPETRQSIIEGEDKTVADPMHCPRRPAS